MATNWKLIREVMNGTIDACEAVEKVNPTVEEYEARSDYQDDVCVEDFLERFCRYPEGAARDIVTIRSKLGSDQREPSQIARALVNSARACAEAIGVADETLDTEIPEFEAHCGSGGHSIRSLLEAIPRIQNTWMLTGITKAVEEFRRSQNTERTAPQ